jgi:hypothetical protein
MTVRIARCCEKCSWRAFGEAAASCPEHGTRATYTDRNRSYKGQAVAQAPGFTKKRYDEGTKTRAKSMGGGRS